MRSGLVLLSFFLYSFSMQAQESVFFTGFFPEVSITKILKNENRINFKVENQHILFDNQNQESGELEFRHYRTDLMSFYDWRLSPTKSFSIGIFHRFQKGSDANRIIQQFVLLQRMRSLRMTHRFRTDQTFTAGEKLELRFRYRIALEIPLSGATLDLGEHYLLVSGEPIFSYQEAQLDLENRLVVTLGKLFQNGQKLEWSLDYRTDSFFEKSPRTRLWAKVGYFLNF